MLTDQQVKSAIKRAVAEKRVVALRDTGRVAGLELRAYPGGTGSFAYCYREGESWKRLALGNYGSAFGLVEARRAAEDAKAARNRGEDPVAARDAARASQKAEEKARKAEEEAAARRLKVAEVIKLFLAAKADLPWITRYTQVLELDVVPQLGKKVAETITQSDVQLVVDTVVRRGARTQARRVYEVTRAMLRWAAVPSRGYVRGEPWKGVELPEKAGARTRTLTAAELRWLWGQCDRWMAEDANISRVARLQILLGQRSGEIGGMQHSELADDGMSWTIPTERSKNEVEHTVPLPPLARQLIREGIAAAEQRHAEIDEKEGKKLRRNDYPIFAGERGKPTRSDTMAHAFADAIADANAAAEKAVEATGDVPELIEPFTPHDLRRTMATALEKMGVPMTVISAALNHISVKAASVTSKHYAHSDLSMEVRAALTRWQATVERIIAGDDPFATRAEDIAELEQRMLAKGAGGPAHLRVVA